MDAQTWPDWVTKDVLPQLAGRVRGVQLLGDKTALVFLQEKAVVAERGRLKGVTLRDMDYPQGLLLNGSHCPHCGGVILEPVAKVARLASEPSPAPAPPQDEASEEPARRAGRGRPAGGRQRKA